MEVGLILALVAAALQTAVLGMGLASRYDDDDAHTGAQSSAAALARPFQ